MQDFWSFRPAAPRLDLPPFVAGRSQSGAPVQSARPAAPEAPRPGAHAPSATPPAPPPFSGAPREADVEVIQDAIKKLLAEVNAAEGQTPSKQAARAATAPATTSTQSTKGIESSLEALRMTADTMRAASQHGARAAKAAALPSFAPPASGQETWKPAPKAAPAPMGARAAVIAEAISEGRMDVLLEPILGLEDQRTRHFEVAIRLRDAAGAPLTVTADGELRGTGLLPLFDCARIARVSAVASRLEERGKSGSLFSSFTGESLSDDRFLGDLTENVHKRAALAGQLVLTFAQSEIRDFGPAEWDTIADMRALGFRFALAGVTHLDMDFEELAGAGFTYVKLDADVFLRGLPVGGGTIPANDICRHLAKLGLTLVVERIDDEDKLARVFGFGVLFGQGQLFGGARSMKATAVSSGEAAA